MALGSRNSVELPERRFAMLNQITKILSRFFSIFGGYSAPEDLRRARQAQSAAKNQPKR